MVGIMDNQEWEEAEKRNWYYRSTRRMEESTTTIALVMSLKHVVVELWPSGPKVVVDPGALEVMTSCKLCLLSCISFSSLPFSCFHYCRGEDFCYSFDPWNDANADANCLLKPDETMTWPPSGNTNPNDNGEGWKVVCK